MGGLQVLNSLVGSTQVKVLEQALNASSFRQRVISNNIANVDTPGFKKSEVSFEDQLNKAIGVNNEKKLPLVRTNGRHLPLPLQGTDIAPEIQTITNTSLRNDGNNVDIDIEMASLAKNSIYYDALAQQMNRYFSGIKSAINEGRR
ncbi:flagellar basal body rod protein FlgB [Methylomusa anaerophila]|uniref:Flagellar basal body rod protein FlgB n=2 Tax=Methylomusa anaerophila TaxID=1930071 RepID=A0A348AQ44_9FIRM|nr:flagellar basal body rod protein FlgB [Methylomusa anaerophila]